MTIRRLPPAVAAGIAAGEVIERPASVVKELVENSIDSGATSIIIEIQQGGLQSIRVSDDGSGIAADEVELAFERHATSKLVSLEGLARVATLGFRGEALASIAAAAHVRMVTRAANATVATVVEAAGGKVERRAMESAAQGTTVVVEALFSTIPARLKFIKSASAETARIRQVVDHMAMANPHVRFSLTSERRTLVQASGNGDLRDVFASVYGTEIAAKAIEVVPSARAPHPAHGMVGAPEHSRPNRSGISLFVNGRWIVNASLNAAIHEAYRGLLMEGRFPFAVMFVDVPPELVDVNVHPNKREIRFRHDGDVFSSVERSVRESLLEAHPGMEARGLFTSAAVPSSAGIPQFERHAAPQAFDFILSPDAGAWAPLPQPSTLGDDLAPEDQQSSSDEPPKSSDGSAFPSLRVLGQISNTYIVAESAEGMQLIDQHAAHESVLYYRLLNQWREQAPEVQPMLEPLPVELTPEQMDALALAGDILERYGMTL
ncbi:MAG: DNA mismatch repair endonuclease MutL, partial [Chloroflexi bacterium]|nr:DNA mismatch repair endonuclease MutL [Chloroflexota bacterium]